MNPILSGFLASLCAGLGTGIGALVILLPIQFTDRAQGWMLGVGGGIMLAATSFSLIIPAIEAAQILGWSQGQMSLGLGFGILTGAGFLWFAHEHFPHEHFFKGREGPDDQTVTRIWLFVLAITLHNLPEGLAVGVGFGGNPDWSNALALATGIGLQNVPEGLVVAIALRNLNYSSPTAALISLATGMVEPIGGLIGASVVSIAKPLLPLGMTFAAGAMLFVILDEIIPDVNQKGLGQAGTFGVTMGFVAMVMLSLGLA